MKINIRRKLFFFSFTILLSNLLIGYAVYTSNQKRVLAEHWVEHTEQVISLSGNILSLAKDIESTSGGFAITNDSTFLQPLVSSGKTAFTNITELRQLVNDNPRQQQRIDSLNFYVHKRLDYSIETVELRSKKGLESASVYISTKHGMQYTSAIRQITNAIVHEENTLLKQRKEENERSVAELNRFLVFMFAIMVMFTILLIIAAGNYLVQHKAKEKRAAELIIANKELVFQNKEKENRARELMVANKELETFNYISNHHMQEPLRKIMSMSGLVLEKEQNKLSDTGKHYLQRIHETGQRMRMLIEDLLSYSQIKNVIPDYEITDLNIITKEVIKEFEELFMKSKQTLRFSNFAWRT